MTQIVWYQMLDTYQKKIELGEIADGQTLKQMIHSLHLHQKTDLEWLDSEEAALKQMLQVQMNLIDKVKETHKNEKNEKLKTIVQNKCSAREVDYASFDGKSGHLIGFYSAEIAPVYLVGDLHGDVCSLMQVLDRTNFYDEALKKDNPIKLIFLGDYIDRGKRQIEILERLMVLKILFPKNVYLHRGNHDSGFMEKEGLKLGIRKPDNEPEIDYILLIIEMWEKQYGEFLKGLTENYLELFYSMNPCGFLKNKEFIYMLSHGGILRPSVNADRAELETCYPRIGKLADLTDPKGLDAIERTRIHNLMWSDPWTDDIDIEKENGRFRFNEPHFRAFKTLFDFDVLVRGHQAFEEGVRYFFDQQVISIFSSGKNATQDNLDTAYNQIRPMLMKINSDSHEILELF